MRPGVLPSFQITVSEVHGKGHKEKTASEQYLKRLPKNLQQILAESVARPDLLAVLHASD
eukprot:4435799-Prymnesium_polylepis.2